MFSIFNKRNTVTNIEWLGVDIHSHLLPGLDDGSPDLENSLFLIKSLSELGYSRLYCTPHIFTELYPNSMDTILPALKTVKIAAQEAGIITTLGAAAEYMVDDTFRITDSLLTLPGNYILIEMSYLSQCPNIELVISDLMEKRYKVILAHPERYLYYRSDKSMLVRLKEMGVYFQLNMLSVFGHYGREVKKLADYLLAQKLYDLVSTDLHHEKHLKELKLMVEDGSLYRKLGTYPFRNKELFL